MNIAQKQPHAIVTGAGGFIGSHLVTFLKKKGYKVTGVDIKKPEFVPSSADAFVLQDLTDWRGAKKILRDANELYMLAADMGGVGYINTVNAAIVRHNTLINSNSLQAAVENTISKVFFASSACVYPEQKQDKLNIKALKESDALPAQPDTPYGWEKLYAEQSCLSYAKDYDIEVRIARFHNIFGPFGTFDGGREKSPAAICRKIAQAVDKGTVSIWGDGKQQRSYCYIDDCLEGIWKLMNSSHSRPINIGSDRMVSINKLVEVVAKVAGKKVNINHDLSKPQGVRSRNADITLAKEILNWEPRVSLEQGLKQTYEWINKQLR
jgi:nucleoside-diphosphate-sugar epimerase